MEGPKGHRDLRVWSVSSAEFDGYFIHCQRANVNTTSAYFMSLEATQI